MQLIRLLGNKEYVFKCSICHVELKILVDRHTPAKDKQKLIDDHIKVHKHEELVNTISKALLERQGEEFI